MLLSMSVLERGACPLAGIGVARRFFAGCRREWLPTRELRLLFGQAAKLLRHVIRGQGLVAREARAVLLELSTQLPVKLLLLLMVGWSGGRRVRGRLLSIAA